MNGADLRPAGARTPGPAAPAAPRRPAGRRKKSPMARAEARAGLTLITPTLVIVVAVVVLPVAWTFLLAFQDVGLMNIRYVSVFGNYTLQNFAGVLTAPGFLEALVTTVVYSVLGTAGAIGLGLVAALTLRRSFRGSGFVRASILLPYVAPVVAVTYVWRTMLNPQFGVVNHWGTELFGWDGPVAFLSEESRTVSLFGLDVGIPVALLTVIAFEAWRSFPFAFLFLSARIGAVPASLEEAARVDGASPTQRFRYILLPQLLPTIAVLTVLRFIWTFNSFDDIYLLTGGGAGTEVVAVRVFNFLTARGDIGAAAAQALVLATILAVLVTVYLRHAGRREEKA